MNICHAKTSICLVLLQRAHEVWCTGLCPHGIGARGPSDPRILFWPDWNISLDSTWSSPVFRCSGDMGCQQIGIFTGLCIWIWVYANAFAGKVLMQKSNVTESLLLLVDNGFWWCLHSKMSLAGEISCLAGGGTRTREAKVRQNQPLSCSQGLGTVMLKYHITINNCREKYILLPSDFQNGPWSSIMHLGWYKCFFSL